MKFLSSLRLRVPSYPQLTCALQAQGILQGGGQGEFALVAESAREVIQIDGPDHGTSKVVLLEPVSLWELEKSPMKFRHQGQLGAPRAINGNKVTGNNSP